MMSAMELMLCTVARGYFDPLTMFWLCLISSQNVWDWFHHGLITDAYRVACHRMLYYATMYGTPSTVKKILLGCTVARNCISDADTPTHRMWTVKYTRISRMEVLYKYSPSNEFVEHTASVAFLYMRPIIGRDVAGIIARMVAQMYLDDYKWLKIYHCASDGVTSWFEMQLRERIIRWLV